MDMREKEIETRCLSYTSPIYGLFRMIDLARQLSIFLNENQAIFAKYFEGDNKALYNLIVDTNSKQIEEIKKESSKLKEQILNDQTIKDAIVEERDIIVEEKDNKIEMLEKEKID